VARSEGGAGPLAGACGLVIGIAAYHRIRPLAPAVANDAREVHAALVDPGLGGYQPARCQLLLEGAATGANLREALAILAARAGPASVVVVYLSGHGARIRSGPHAGDYLLPVDVVADSAAELAASAISSTELAGALSAIEARRALIVLDCCHASGLGTLPGWAPDEGLSERSYDTIQAGGGRAVLASSRETEASYLTPGAANSLFTRHLLAGLAGGVPSEDGYVRVFDLFEYLQPRVTIDEPRQHPVFKAHLEENFPVVLRRDGPKGPALAADGFRYDVYVSYLDREPDATWVWQTLVPRLERAGLSVAVSGDVEQPGVARVVGIERGIRQSRRTVVVLSAAYLADGLAEFENTLAQTLGIQEGTYRLLPVRIGAIGSALPTRLAMLTTLNLAPGPRLEREFGRMLRALEGPLPGRV
jgi:hypothetical protein